jgi:type III secretory pathway component EscU
MKTLWLVVSIVWIVFSIAGLIFFSWFHKRLMKISKDMNDLAERMKRKEREEHGDGE